MIRMNKIVGRQTYVDRICDLPILFAILEKSEEEGRLWVSEDFLGG